MDCRGARGSGRNPTWHPATPRVLRNHSDQVDPPCVKGEAGLKGAPSLGWGGGGGGKGCYAHEWFGDMAPMLSTPFDCH